jgi:hypothetical protein
VESQRTITCGELLTEWGESVVTYFKILSWHSLELLRKSTKTLIGIVGIPDSIIIEVELHPENINKEGFSLSRS